MFRRYKTTPEKDSSGNILYRIHQVPIFAPMYRENDDGAGGPMDYNEEWINTAVTEGNRRQHEEGSLPTLYLEHPINKDKAPSQLGEWDEETNRQVAGFMENQEVKKIMYRGEPTPVIFTDLVIVSKDVFDEMYDANWPGISVEISHTEENNPQAITSAALLNVEPSAVKFPPLVPDKPRELVHFSEYRIPEGMDPKKAFAGTVVCFSETPRRGSELQTIVVPKAKAKSRIQAERIASKYGTPGTIRETSTSYRFRQETPRKMQKDEYKTDKKRDASLVYSKRKQKASEEFAEEPREKLERDAKLGIPGAKEKLFNLGEREGMTPFTRAIRNINSEDEQEKLAAIHSLEHLSDKKAIPYLLRALKRDKGKETLAVNLIGALSSLKAKEAAPLIEKVFRGASDNDLIRNTAVIFLGEIGHKSPLLIEALSDKNNYVRENALETIINLDMKNALPTIEERLKDPNTPDFERPYLRFAVEHFNGEEDQTEYAEEPRERLEQRAKMGDPENIDRLVSMLEREGETSLSRLFFQIKKGSQSERLSALNELFEQKTIKALPGIIHALNDEDNGIRAYAALYLGELGFKDAIPALINATRDTDFVVKKWANAALKSLGYKPDTQTEYAESPKPAKKKTSHEQHFTKEKTRTPKIEKLRAEWIEAKNKLKRASVQKQSRFNRLLRHIEANGLLSYRDYIQTLLMSRKGKEAVIDEIDPLVWSKEPGLDLSDKDLAEAKKDYQGLIDAQRVIRETESPTKLLLALRKEEEKIKPEENEMQEDFAEEPREELERQLRRGVRRGEGEEFSERSNVGPRKSKATSSMENKMLREQDEKEKYMSGGTFAEDGDASSEPLEDISEEIADLPEPFQSIYSMIAEWDEDKLEMLKAHIAEMNDEGSEETEVALDTEMEEYGEKTCMEEDNMKKKRYGIDNSPVSFSEKIKKMPSRYQAVFSEMDRKIKSLESVNKKNQDRQKLESEIKRQLANSNNREKIRKDVLKEFDANGLNSAMSSLKLVASYAKSYPNPIKEDMSAPERKAPDEVVSKYSETEEMLEAAERLANAWSPDRTNLDKDEYVELGMKATFSELRDPKRANSSKVNTLKEKK